MNGAPATTMRSRPPKIAICLPSGETWKASTGASLFCLGVMTAVAGAEIVLINNKSGDAAENRNHAVRMGREWGADWYLFLDADMTFQPDAALRLMKWNVDVVGADYRMRAQPFTKLGTSEQGPYPADHQEPEEGLVERGILGLGLLLVRAAVFEKLPAPWFARTWIPEQATPDNPYGFSTDDSYFCHYARHHGFKVHCDLAVTHGVAHIGEIYVPWKMGAT